MISTTATNFVFSVNQVWLELLKGGHQQNTYFVIKDSILERTHNSLNCINKKKLLYNTKMCASKVDCL